MPPGRFAILAPSALLLAHCGYPEFGFTPVSDSGAAPMDSTTPDTALEDLGADVAPESRLDAEDAAATDTTVTDATAADTTVTDTAVMDTGPSCTSNLQCPCGEICSLGKCTASTDCTKDSHYCPSGVTCKCIAGRWDIDGTIPPGSGALVPAQPFTVADNNADLNLRNYSIHDTAGTLFAMRIRPANCTSGWHFKNINIQCVDFANLDAAGARALSISRRTDPLSCRPPSPPELLLDRVNISTLDSYSVFEDVEFSKVTLRKVTTTGSGILVAAWGPGRIDQLIVEDSPNVYAELQGKVPVVTVTRSPGLKWWITGPGEVRDATWPLITITYDKASCPVGRSLTNTGQVKEICLST